MNSSIKIYCGSKEHIFSIEENEPIAPLLQKHELMDFPCAMGKCGKCLIYANSTPCEEEISRLGYDATESGLRLACHTRATKGLKITIPDKKQLCVLSAFTDKEYDYLPVVSKIPCRVSSGSTKSADTDLERVLASLNLENHSLSLSQQAQLPYLLRGQEKLYAMVYNNTLTGISDAEAHYGLTVDIGTTTVSATLLDLDRKKISGVKGAHNPQHPYGADVVTRIKHTMEKGTSSLQRAIVRQIDQFLLELKKEAGVDDVSIISITGNTTMMHMLCGLPSEFIGKAPFTPVNTQAMRLNARELGLSSSATVFLMPCISSYIGADIVASLLAMDAHKKSKPFLLIDLGTNAETVLFANNKFYCCSSAAGPCFEGVTLSCGMAGQPGAIDSVEITGSDVTFSVIENKAPCGICGSGVLDAIAVLIDSNALGETGGLKFDQPGPLKDRLDKTKGFMITESVNLTQKDISEVQLAKAAIRAGIEVILQKAGVSAADVETFYLAGGFGSALRAESAVKIGLVPRDLFSRISVLGNAAGFGAQRYITEKEALQNARHIINKAEHMELSTMAEFSEAYIEHMFFPEPGILDTIK